MKKQILLTLIIATHASQGVIAQHNQVRDTLNWQGYYPLSIGNAWEWQTFIPDVWFGGDVNSFNRREIVSDTLIGDHQYFVQTALSFTEYEATMGRNVLVWQEYLRYDTLRTRVAQYDLNQGVELGYTCDLSADFNGVAVCYETVDMGVGGDYASNDNFQIAVGSDSAPFNATKIYAGLSGGSKFFHGIGSMPVFGDGTGGTIEFTYVKIDDNEYGARAVGVGTEALIKHDEIKLDIFPNPARSELNLITSETVPGIKTRIIDVLGRSSTTHMVCNEKRCSIDVSTYSPGMYLLEYKDAKQFYGSQIFVVTN